MPIIPVRLGSNGKYWAKDSPPAQLVDGETQHATATTAYMTVRVDMAGTLYWVVTGSSTPPSYAAIRAGTGATDYGTVAVTIPDSYLVAADGLLAGATYYFHVFHDYEGRQSNIVSSAIHTESGGEVYPVCVSCSGNFVHLQSVTISTDGINNFGASQGTVWISTKDTWGAAGAITRQQTVTEWTDTSITITVDATNFGGAAADLSHNFLIVRDSAGFPVKFTAHDARAIRSARTKLGLNVGFTRYFAGVYHFRNIAKTAPITAGSSWVTPKSGTYDVSPSGWLSNASDGAVATLRIYMHGDDPPSAEIYGRYVVYWTGSAKCGIGAAGTPPLYYNSSQFYTDIDETTDNLFLWFTNDSGSPMASFVTDIIMMRIDDQVGATDAIKASAALADYAAGLAALDERIFNPRYLTELQSLNPQALRFMDWCGANGNTYPDWDQRVPLDSVTWAAGGSERIGAHDGWSNRMTPWEVIFALARYIAPPLVWVNLPVRATDAHVASFAQFIEDNYSTELASGKKLVVECGNELWNTAPGFHTCSQIANLEYGYGYPLLEATYDGVTGTYTLANHGFGETQEIYAISGSTDATGIDHPAVGLAGNQVPNPRYRYTANVTTDTFELVDGSGVPVPPETAGAGTLRFYQSVPDRFKFVREGATKRQCDVLKILKDNLTEASWGGILRTLVFRDNTSATTWTRKNLDIWYSYANGYAQIGHVQAIAGAPYLRQADTALPKKEVPVWNNEQSYIKAIAYIDSYTRFASSLRAAIFTLNKPWSSVAHDIKMMAYEGGMSASEELTTTNEALMLDWVHSQYGADIVAYYLKNIAASGELSYYNYYSDIRQGSPFSLRESVLVQTDLSTYWESLAGEI